MELHRSVPDELATTVSFVVENVGGRGGDRAVAFRCPDGNLHVFVCDVAGSGEDAAAIGDFLEHAVRILACQGMSLACIVETLDLGLHHFHGNEGRFASMFVARIDADALTYVSAGHPDALLFDGAAHHRHLGATGPLIGVFAGAAFAERRVPVVPGGTLVVVTDGVLDAKVVSGGRLGHHGLARFAADALGRADDAARAIAADLRLHGTTDDDFAVLAAAM